VLCMVMLALVVLAGVCACQQGAAVNGLLLLKLTLHPW
jgi:hypothetical protein